MGGMGDGVGEDFRGRVLMPGPGECGHGMRGGGSHLCSGEERVMSSPSSVVV